MAEKAPPAMPKRSSGTKLRHSDDPQQAIADFDPSSLPPPPAHLQPEAQKPKAQPPKAQPPKAQHQASQASRLSTATFDSSEDEDEEARVPKGQAVKRDVSVVRKMPKYHPMDIAKYDELLCEGYLTKVKGNALASKTRHFRLTSKSLSYFQENGAELISSVPKGDIETAKQEGKCRIRLKLKTAIGRNKGKNELLLEAANSRVREKWMHGLTVDLSRRTQPVDELIIEGYLTKVQPLCTTNTTRWFRITQNTFGYYKDEEGELYAKISLDAVDIVTHTEDKREFKVCANVPMTKTRFYEVICRAANAELRNKWVAMLQRVLPQHKMSSELQMCCYMVAS